MSQRRTLRDGRGAPSSGTAGSGPRGTRRPGRRPGPRTARQPAAAAEVAQEKTRRPRLTGRAAVLVLVLAVLAVSYASSLKAYLQQRAHIADLHEQIAQRSADIDALEREKRRWHDEAYIRAQARERFGFVMPGATSYVVLDEKGRPVESRARLHDPKQVLAEPPSAWWNDAWESVELAGNPPKDQPPPATDIDTSRP